METGAHAALMVVTCSPVLIANYMFKYVSIILTISIETVCGRQ